MSDLRKQLSHGRVLSLLLDGGELTSSCFEKKKKFSVCFHSQIVVRELDNLCYLCRLSVEG